jgi:hypothetical protein
LFHSQSFLSRSCMDFRVEICVCNQSVELPLVGKVIPYFRTLCKLSMCAFPIDVDFYIIFCVKKVGFLWCTRPVFIWPYSYFYVLIIIVLTQNPVFLSVQKWVGFLRSTANPLERWWKVVNSSILQFITWCIWSKRLACSFDTLTLPCVVTNWSSFFSSRRQSEESLLNKSIGVEWTFWFLPNRGGIKLILFVPSSVFEQFKVFLVWN